MNNNEARTPGKALEDISRGEVSADFCPKYLTNTVNPKYHQPDVNCRFPSHGIWSL